MSLRFFCFAARLRFPSKFFSHIVLIIMKRLSDRGVPTLKYGEQRHDIGKKESQGPSIAHTVETANIFIIKVPWDQALLWGMGQKSSSPVPTWQFFSCSSVIQPIPYKRARSHANTKDHKEVGITGGKGGGRKSQ